MIGFPEQKEGNVGLNRANAQLTTVMKSSSQKRRSWWREQPKMQAAYPTQGVFVAFLVLLESF